MLPPYLRALFWDVNAKTFSPLEFPQYAIARVLEYGDREAIAWMKESFYESEIVNVLRTERRLTPKSANFWALIYHIPHENVAALKGARTAVKSPPRRRRINS